MWSKHFFSLIHSLSFIIVALLLKVFFNKNFYFYHYLFLYGDLRIERKAKFFFAIYPCVCMFVRCLTKRLVQSVNATKKKQTVNVSGSKRFGSTRCCYHARMSQWTAREFTCVFRIQIWFYFGICSVDVEFGCWI